MSLGLPPPDLLLVFNALPGANLLLSPEWYIVAASDDYLAATLTQRATIVGQFIFDAFPENPHVPEANAVSNVRDALEQVLATGRPHQMPPQHYDVPDRTQPGRFVERHWLPRHTPVLDAAGQVQFIIQSVQDITASRMAQRQLHESQASERAARADEQVARADARQQRADFQYFIEQAPVAVAVYHGPEFRIEMANATTLAIWGRPLEAVLHRPVFEALPEAATPDVMALFERVFTTGITHTSYEQPTIIDRHGQRETVYWNFVFEPQRDASGRVSGIFTVGTEVTAQVLARQQVEQLNQELETRVQERTQTALGLQAELLAAAQQQADQRALLYQVFEETPAAICIQRGPEHHYEYVNAAYQAFFPGREFIGRPVAEVLPETVDSGVVGLLDHVYQTGETYYGYELPLLIAQPDGPPKQMYFTFTYQAYRENGQIVGISTFAYNVAAQVLVRQQQQEQQQKLHALFEQAPVGIAIQTGPNLVYEYTNAAYQRLVPNRQLLGRPFFEVFSEMAGTNVETLLRHVYETGETQQEQNLLIPVARADGSSELDDRYFTLVYQAQRDEHGHVNGVLAFVVEVTEQVHAGQREEESRQELKQANEQLRRTNVDLDNFIYTASHDLKQPIANIEGLLHALQYALPPEGRVGEVPTMLDLMQAAIERFGRTIAHLTDISRLQQEHNQPSSLVLLARVVHEVKLDLAPLQEKTQAQVDIHIPADVTLRFSEKNLRSVVYNLLSNALKYHHPDRAPVVTITHTLLAAEHLLEVRDNGLGLDVAQDQGKLFGMFQRLHPHIEGSGVGLYMVKKIVENAGGRIEVESELHQGSSFRVYFPR
ncbi:PAS domain-containing protein [Hymenobacter sediminis]|uniref:PAS domain-containing sensor histidine kinase n=1 Tax=Hymenobacter sediminis TaxID=2218621 RepID=UPI000DA671FF|nr:PAS domain-containing protein [Hymenobacter sediminis]RPD49589.1 PAS domain-containing protein [Hymenobacter sediminis]